MAIDKSFVNVMVLSFGFMMVFAAFQTMSNIEVSLPRDRNNLRCSIFYRALVRCSYDKI